MNYDLRGSLIVWLRNHLHVLLEHYGQSVEWVHAEYDWSNDTIVLHASLGDGKLFPFRVERRTFCDTEQAVYADMEKAVQKAFPLPQEAHPSAY